MKTTELYKIYQKHQTICTDTRKISNGCLFFALKGENYDANEFALEAIQNGASYAIIDDAKYFLSSECILVDNVLETLQLLANYHRQKLDIPFIGITGSNGKTTTKELINAVLQQKYRTIATKGNLNNHIGVPLTILSIPKDCEIAIIEMGANHIGEIELLCNIAEPNFGIITNIGTAHIEGFGSREGVIKTKNELYEFIRNTNGKLFINKNDELLVSLAKGIDCVEYSKIYINVIESNPFLSFIWKEITINTQLYGDYNIPNILAAIKVGEYFNVDNEKIINGLENYVSSNNRSQIVEQNNQTLFLDAYNANPTSMEAAINSFSTLKDGTKLMVIGDMLELGYVSKEEHQKIASKINELNFEAIFIGKEFQKIDLKYHFTFLNNYEEAINWFENSEKIYNKILIKGSRGIKLEKVAEYLQKREP